MKIYNVTFYVGCLNKEITWNGINDLKLESLKQQSDIKIIKLKEV